ncbi:MAG: terpene synthase family protein [Pseudonocardiaceae bacterium]
MTSTTTPFINLPFPVRQHPQFARIETSTHEWVVRFRLANSDAATKGLVRSRFGVAAAYGYPDAPLPEAELAAGWFAWLFFVDDQHEEGTHGSAQRWTDVIEAVGGVLESGLPTGPLAGTPLIRALADLSHRFDALASPAWKKRFARHLMGIMAGGLRDIQLREGGTPLPLADYIALRRDASAVLTCFDVIEICVHTVLSDQVYHSSIFQEIVLAGADLFSWINDLYSLDKEIACGIVSNLILVLQHERRITREQAFIAARALINDRVNDLLAAEQRLPELIDTLQLDTVTQEAVHRYVAGIHDCIAGANHWHAHGTGRYQKPATGTVALSPVEDLLS